MSDNLVDNIRKEHYPLQIYTAFNNNPKVIGLTTKLITEVQGIYRSLEPSHFKGEIIVFVSLDDEVVLNEEVGVKLFDRNLLINNTSKSLVVQIFQSDRLPLMWQNVESNQIIEATSTITYLYNNFKESFVANRIKIEIINRFNSASIYALQYHYLDEALVKYKEEKIKYSSCSIFNECWFDKATRIYLKQGPEEQMQISLKEFLDSSLRGVEVVREYNLGASKPVDVRVYWKEANRAALIELKWLGRSKKNDGTLSTKYSNGRANQGLDQLKEYLDLEGRDTPTVITKGYLVIIDGRRKGTDKNLTAINVKDGLYYEPADISIAATKQYFRNIIGFEKPIRMFVKPVCI